MDLKGFIDMSKYIFTLIILSFVVCACSNEDNDLNTYSQDNEYFTLQAKYKNKIYSTEAKIDKNGDMVFLNEDYRDLMIEIDKNPTSQLVIMHDGILNYYDADDIKDNLPFYDSQSLDTQYNYPNRVITRATGFEDFNNDDLGFMAVYDNDNFGGKMLSKGLSNFHFTYNIPSLKPYSMNDKITSLTVGYNGTDPIVCAVLTIWEDTDYNYNDNDRKKHRISIMASKNSPRVSCPDLKKIKKIGSSKSWNDCISSFSLHFGYTDRLLLDY